MVQSVSHEENLAIRSDVDFYKELVSFDKISTYPKEIKNLLLETYKSKLNEMLDKLANEDEAYRLTEINAFLNNPLISTKDKVLFEAKKTKISNSHPEFKNEDLSEFQRIILATQKENSNLHKRFKTEIMKFNSIRVNNISPMTLEDLIINNNCLHGFNEDINKGSAVTNPILNFIRICLELVDIYSEKLTTPDSEKNHDQMIERHFKTLASQISWLAFNVSTNFLVDNAQTKDILTGVAFIFDFLFNCTHLQMVKQRQKIHENELMQMTQQFLQAKYEHLTDAMIKHYIEYKCYDKIHAFSILDKDTFIELETNLGDRAQALLNGANQDNFADIELTIEQYDLLIRNISDSDLIKKFKQMEYLLSETQELKKSVEGFIDLHQRMREHHTREVKYIQIAMTLSIIFFIGYCVMTGFFGAIKLDPNGFILNYLLLTGAGLGTAIQILAAVFETLEKIEQETDDNIKFALKINLVSNIISQFIFPALSITTNLYVMPALGKPISPTLMLIALFVISRSLIELLKNLSLYFELTYSHQLKPEDKIQLAIICENYRQKMHYYSNLEKYKQNASPSNTDEQYKNSSDSETQALIKTEENSTTVDATDQQLEKIKLELIEIRNQYYESFNHVYAKEIALGKFKASSAQSLAYISLFSGIILAEYFPNLEFIKHLTNSFTFNPTLAITITVFLFLQFVIDQYEDSIYTSLAILKPNEDAASPHPKQA